MAIQIMCINKDNRYNPREAITHVGGINPDGRCWRLQLQEAIQSIENGKYSFYVEQPSGDIVNVVVAVSAAGNKYLKTEADGDEPNNLLSLNECK
jgi:hypothetical protein